MKMRRFVLLYIVVFGTFLAISKCSTIKDKKYLSKDVKQGRYEVWFDHFKKKQVESVADVSNSSENLKTSAQSSRRFQIVIVDWQRVKNYVIVCLWILLAGFSRILFRSRYMNVVVSRVPESCLLICVGVVVGGIAYAIDKTYHIDQLLFNHDTFFLIILPPIVLEAGYFMPKQPFFNNIGTILTYAIVGTLFNTFAIGYSLYGVFIAGWMPNMTAITALDCLLFGSIISAVDPVAVIAVFEEINVNVVLYICVFGESLLNDGVAVVLYRLFEQYIELPEVILIDYVAAAASFFVVVVGGLSLGIIYGYFGTFITKYTVKNRVFEPTFVLVTCYLSYLTAEIFHLSSIIAIVFSGFIMKSYVPYNISPKSHLTVKYVMKMMASISETIIFMLLGVVVFSDYWKYWNTGFVLWTLFFITIHRAIGVVVLTYVINLGRMEKISYVDQFVMAYGGLRGAIAFSLVSLTSEETIPGIKTMVCACIVCILFTSFIQGITIRPIVEFLKVRMERKHQVTMFEDINFRLIDHVLAGIEDCVGHKGQHYWYYRFGRINTSYLMRWFVRDPYKTRDQVMLQTFRQINEREAQNMLAKIEGRRESEDSEETDALSKLLMTQSLTRSDSMGSISSITEENNIQSLQEHTNLVTEERQESIVSSDVSAARDMLSKNMYHPRATTNLRYRRGTIDLSNAQKRQQREIIMRRQLQDHAPGLRKFRKYGRHVLTAIGMRAKNGADSTMVNNAVSKSESTIQKSEGYTNGGFENESE